MARLLVFTVSCLALMARASAFNIRIPLFNEPTPILPAAHVEITSPPSAEALDLRLRAAIAVRAVTCASACVNSFVTKSTDCTLSDLTCECSTLNADIIYAGAYSCVADACGYLVAASYFDAAASVCSSIEDGDYTDITTASVESDDTTETTAITASGRAGKTTVITSTDDSGSTYTSVYAAPTPVLTSSSSGSGSSGSSSSSDTSSSGLSKGAIAGIAVGATVGAIAVILLAAFAIWKSCQRNKSSIPTTSSALDAAFVPPPAGLPAEKAELGGRSKPYNAAEAHVHGVPPTGTPASNDPSGVSRHPSVISTPSPAPPVSPISGHNLLYAQPPAYPPVPELNAQVWQQQQQWMQALPSQPTYPAAGGYPQPGQPVPGVQYQEVPGVRPEVMGDTSMRQELHGRPYTTGPYEMPGGSAPSCQ